MYMKQPKIIVFIVAIHSWHTTLGCLTVKELN